MRTKKLLVGISISKHLKIGLFGRTFGGLTSIKFHHEFYWINTFDAFENILCWIDEIRDRLKNFELEIIFDLYNSSWWGMNYISELVGMLKCKYRSKIKAHSHLDKNPASLNKEDGSKIWHQALLILNAHVEEKKNNYICFAFWRDWF